MLIDGYELDQMIMVNLWSMMLNIVNSWSMMVVVDHGQWWFFGHGFHPVPSQRVLSPLVDEAIPVAAKRRRARLFDVHQVLQLQDVGVTDLVTEQLCPCSCPGSPGSDCAAFRVPGRWVPIGLAELRLIVKHG